MNLDSIMTRKHDSSNKPSYTKPPDKDTLWALEQKPSVHKFWSQCWLADPYGSRWMKIVTNLSDSAFRFARKVLTAAGLFIFRRVSDSKDGRTSTWEVKNLHGARIKEFWQSKKNEAYSASSKSSKDYEERVPASNKADTSPQTQSEQELQNSLITPQEHFNNSSKELLKCGSSMQNENLDVSDTADVPLGGTSPQAVESMEEEERQPTMEEEQTVSASSDSKDQAINEEPIAENEDIIAAPQADSEVNSVDWNEEARLERKKLRPERKRRLIAALAIGQNPGIEFLRSCWEDIPLTILVKQLISKFPEWGLSYEGMNLCDSDSRNNCS